MAAVFNEEGRGKERIRSRNPIHPGAGNLIYPYFARRVSIFAKTRMGTAESIRSLEMDVSRDLRIALRDPRIRMREAVLPFFPKGV